MYHKIIERNRDLANKYVIRAMLNNNDSFFLWFNEEPTQEQVDIEMDKVEEQLLNNNLLKPKIETDDEEDTSMGYLKELRGELLNPTYRGLSNEQTVALLNAKSTTNTDIPVWQVVGILTQAGSYVKIYDAANDVNHKDHASAAVVRDMFLSPNFSTIDMSVPTIQQLIDSFSADTMSDELKAYLKSLTNETESRAQTLFNHDVTVEDVIAAKAM